MNPVQKILNLFRIHSIGVGQVLPKAHLTAELQSWPPAEKAQMRNAWHTLVGEGLIAEGHPEGPTLTPKGAAALDSLSNPA
ncbi:MAG: hypothetical protein NXI24_01025 [bacterium]|nr:hypothetical protein [bacterium]